MASNRTTVGNVEVVAFSDARVELALVDVFPSVPANAWDPYKKRFPSTVSPSGKWQNNFGAYALRSAGKTVLVDTGIGPGPIDAFGGIRGELLAQLVREKIRPDDVDVVFFTHLHPDHVGWSMAQGARGKSAPTFPKARYVVNEADWRFFGDPQNWKLLPFPYVEKQLVPLKEMGRLDIVSGEHAITAELTATPTPGHTPGHMSVVITSGTQRGIILGDVVNHPAQVTEVDWISAFDGDPETAQKTRERMMERLEKEKMFIAVGHFPTPGFGRLVVQDRRRYWSPL